GLGRPKRCTDQPDEGSVAPDCGECHQAAGAIKPPYSHATGGGGIAANGDHPLVGWGVPLPNFRCQRTGPDFVAMVQQSTRNRVVAAIIAIAIVVLMLWVFLYFAPELAARKRARVPNKNVKLCCRSHLAGVSGHNVRSRSDTGKEWGPVWRGLLTIKG